MSSDSRAYKAIFEYLVQNHDIHNPAQPSEIADATGVSRSSVYRLLTKKRNGASPDETASAGIFLAPETFTVYGRRPTQTYYADPKRIKDANTISNLAADRVELPFAFEDFIVRPVVLTPSVLALMQKERSAVNIVLDSKKPWLDFLEAVFTGQADRFASMNKRYSEMSEVFVKARKNYEDSQTGEDTLDRELMKELHEYVQNLAGSLVAQLELLRTVMQVPQFDSNTARIFSEETKKPHLAPPVIKERK